MNNIVNKDNLFCDEYRALSLLEYPKELTLVKQLIELIATAAKKTIPTNTWSHEGICHMFAMSIVDYIKMSYDNLQLGHFYAAQMIFRTIVENIVCLDVIMRHPEYELWKYYLVQSYRSTLLSTGGELKEVEEKFFKEICDDYEIEEAFLAKTKKNDSQRPFAYIDRDYGWTYKINSNFTFAGMCNLIDKREYKDFKYMSMYAHGTSIHLKISGFATIDNIMNILSFYYYCLNRLVALYCTKTIDPVFYNTVDKLERIITRYIKECK